LSTKNDDFIDLKLIRIDLGESYEMVWHLYPPYPFRAAYHTKPPPGGFFYGNLNGHQPQSIGLQLVQEALSMGVTLNDSITNNGGWSRGFYFTASYDNGETTSPIDFTTATIQIEVNDQDGCTLITASTGNGKITVTETGRFELSIPATDMQRLCPGQYPIGGVYQINGSEPISLFTGTLSVRNGVARL